MGELTTLNYSANTKYLRSTVPSFIVKQFGLSVGDKLEWELCAENNEMIIKVRPRKE